VLWGLQKWNFNVVCDLVPLAEDFSPGANNRIPRFPKIFQKKVKISDFPHQHFPGQIRYTEKRAGLSKSSESCRSCQTGFDGGMGHFFLLATVLWHTILLTVALP